jgi:hypothetical protein
MSRKFEEVEVPNVITENMADGYSVRMFKTPSDTEPNKEYYIQAVKPSKDNWGRAILLCNCGSAQFQQALAIMGNKATCKHSKDLRVVLQEKNQ